jgi:hypothetical protein
MVSLETSIVKASWKSRPQGAIKLSSCYGLNPIDFGGLFALCTLDPPGMDITNGMGSSGLTYSYLLLDVSNGLRRGY